MIPSKLESSAWARCLVILLAAAGMVFGDDPDGIKLLQEAQKLVSGYHAGQPASHRVLRVVYFVPADRDPLANHEERLRRIMDDVNAFYQDGFRRFGVEDRELALERKDGKLVIHLVKGKLPAASYNYKSGAMTASEIGESLKGTVDMRQEYVLVIHALCHKEEDGRYVFNAPYYGGAPSSNESGICHAADCELLDPLLLPEKNRRMVYTEHYYPRVEQTVALFNSWYLGGIAHELGHGLGLPHDNGTVGESRYGVSLMGVGNHHYREDLWGGDSLAFFSRGSALQLLSHPLVTGSDRGRGEKVYPCFDTLAFADKGGVLRIEGSVSGTVPAYAVIAHVWPKSAKSDHRAISYPAVLDRGTFHLELTGLEKEACHLKLTSLHLNGAKSTQLFELERDLERGIRVDRLTAEWLVDRAETAVVTKSPKAKEFVGDEAIARAPTPESARKLQVLRSLLEPSAPSDLTGIKEDEVFLSDVMWTDASVGWGRPTRNSFWFDETFPVSAFLMLDGRFHDKGLYAHSPSSYRFQVERKWKILTAAAGLRDGASPAGSAVFVIRGDGKELYRSKLLRVGAREALSVDISEVENLELLTEGGHGNSASSWAIWTDLKVRR